MTISLTIPDLLRQIEADKVDADIFVRCQEAERLCRQGEFKVSEEHARATVESASHLGAATSIGVAFLYLAAIRHVTPRKDAHDQSPRDAETAARWLKRDPHHALIGHLVCACIYAEDGQLRPALRHYREAQTLAAQRISYWHRRNKPDKEKYYQEAQGTLSAAMRELQSPLSTRATSTATENQSAKGETSAASAEADRRTGATPDDASPTIQLKQQNQSDQFTLNYYEISRVWINGQEYLVESVNPVDPENPGLRLLPDQKYIAVPDPDSNQPRQYVLVKEGAQPTQGQIVVNVDPVHLRSWTDQDESTKNPHILGTVEARLRPAPPEAEPEAETEIDEDLLDCIDAITAAANARRKADPGLAAMHKKFLSYLRRKYNLQVIPIKPRKTEFDPAAGHYAVDQQTNRQVPDGVILQVVRDGYTRAGKIVREAHVVVNQK